MKPAVLLTCHGTVDDAADLPAFLMNIRHGRPAPPEVLEEVQRRFARIGGSPLMRITAAQAEALAARLGIPVRSAGRLWRPYPKDVLAELVREGVDTVVSVPLAPQSVHVYQAAVRESARAFDGVSLLFAPPWGEEPALVEACLETVDEGLQAFADPRAVGVVLSAHSLPKRVVDAGDPYERQFRAMAEAVATIVRARGIRTEIAFQSQGMTGDAWLGPDLATTFAHLVREGIRDVLVAPIGFVADHVETLYDLDIEAPELAAKAGVGRFARAPALNTRKRFIDALEAVTRRELATSSR